MTKKFNHITEPYGNVVFEAELVPSKVKRYFPESEVDGFVARGKVISSRWVGAFWCGVAVSKPREKYPVGSEYEVEVTKEQWDSGERRDISM